MERIQKCRCEHNLFFHAQPASPWLECVQSSSKEEAAFSNRGQFPMTLAYISNISIATV